MPKDIEFAVEGGNPVLIENMENSIDAVIQPVYSRAIIKKGKTKYIKMGDKELTLNPKFNLFLHTKLANPHYPPEIQAECTLINFTVTESGLEDQLLALVVRKERPDLASQKEALIQEQNGIKIKLKELESDILYRIANA
jgi:dynein heavy chain